MIRPTLAIAAVSAACALVACGEQNAQTTDDAQDAATAATPVISTILSTSLVTVTEGASAENTEPTVSDPATSQPPTSEPTSRAAPVGPSVEERCELGRLTSDLGVPELDVLSYCDGQWAKIGKNQTDWIVRMYWNGSRWVQPEFDGEKRMGLTQGCYLRESLADVGLPPEELDTPYCQAGDVIY